MAEDGKVVYKIEGDNSQAMKALDEFETEAKKTGQKFKDTVDDTMDGAEKSVSSTASKIAKSIGAAFVVKKVIEFGKAAFALGKSAVEVASDLQEVQNVVDTTFGSDGAMRINEWAKNAAENFGESELQAKQFTSTLGAMFKSMGVAQAPMEEMSISLAGLAGDMASFYNLDPTEAFEKLRSGISGETEPLKQLGINMSVANLEAYAMAQGITKSYQEMTQAEQATLRYQYIMSATADAQGDFADTSDSFANQQRILKLEIESLAAEIGDGLMPVAQELVEWARESVSWFAEQADGVSKFAQSIMDAVSPIVEKLAPKLAEIIEALAPILEPIVDLFGLLAEFIADKVAAALDYIIPIISEVVEIISGYIEKLTDAYEAVTEFSDSIYSKFEPALSVIIEIADDIIDFLGTLVDFTGDVITGFADWGTEADGVGGIISDLADTLNKILVPALEFIGDKVKWLIGLYEAIIEKVREFLQWAGIMDVGERSFDKAVVTYEDAIRNGAYHIEYDTDKNGKTKGRTVVDWDKAEQMYQDGSWDSGGKKSYSRHQSGEDFVMSDWTPAYLDYGERVLTASENAKYTAMGGVDGMERRMDFGASGGGTSAPSRMELGLKVSPREMAHAITPYVISELQAQGKWEDVK